MLRTLSLLYNSSRTAKSTGTCVTARTYVLCGGKVEQGHSRRTRTSDTRYVPPLPLDVFEMVIREAWLDDSFEENIALFLALTYMRDASWRRSLLLIAWKHVVCRTIPELPLYLRLRYGSLLGD
jgi:hypothetical protein